MSKEYKKSVHLTEETHDLLIEKQKEISNKRRIDIKLSELADMIIYKKIKEFDIVG